MFPLPRLVLSPKLPPSARDSPISWFWLFQFVLKLFHMQMLSQYGREEKKREKRRCRNLEMVEKKCFEA
jgi:hypothetical protein